jgi:predicted SnoaL-like aldol condensation-catalyzing enzyme
MNRLKGIQFAWLATISLGTLAQAAPASGSDPNGNLVGLETANGRLVYDFIDLWFNKHQPNAAFDKYVARTGYMNHAVYGATTATANRTFEQEKAEEARVAGPTTHFDVKQIVAQGNLVFVHIAATQGPAGEPAGANPAAPARPAAPMPGGDGKGPDEMIMILRVNNGKIVDHWDMHVPTNSDSVVFAGLDRKLP